MSIIGEAYRLFVQLKNISYQQFYKTLGICMMNDIYSLLNNIL